jgi:inosose dehydratase
VTGRTSSASPGEPVVEDIAKALRALDRDLFVVVEQDIYPCDFGQPKPIAQCTYTYLRSLGIGEQE